MDLASVLGVVVIKGFGYGRRVDTMGIGRHCTPGPCPAPTAVTGRPCRA